MIKHVHGILPIQIQPRDSGRHGRGSLPLTHLVAHDAHAAAQENAVGVDMEPEEEKLVLQEMRRIPGVGYVVSLILRCPFSRFYIAPSLHAN